MLTTEAVNLQVLTRLGYKAPATEVQAFLRDAPTPKAAVSAAMAAFDPRVDSHPLLHHLSGLCQALCAYSAVYKVRVGSHCEFLSTKQVGARSARSSGGHVCCVCMLIRVWSAPWVSRLAGDVHIGIYTYRYLYKCIYASLHLCIDLFIRQSMCCFFRF
jgi:hypothetical protein